MNSSGRNDGPSCLALRWIAAACRIQNLGYVEATFEALLNFAWTFWCLFKGAFVEAFAKKCKELFAWPEYFGRLVDSLYIRETKTKLFCFSASYRPCK